MSHSSTTPKKHLPLFSKNDRPAWLTDWNNAMAIIDDIEGGGGGWVENPQLVGLVTVSHEDISDSGGSILAGNNNVSDYGNNSIGVGNNVRPIANNTAVFGYNCEANNINSFAAGQGCTVNNKTAAAVGLGVVADQEGEVAVGKYNARARYLGKRVVFNVGRGNSDSDRRVGFIVDSEGICWCGLPYRAGDPDEETTAAPLKPACDYEDGYVTRTLDKIGGEEVYTWCQTFELEHNEEDDWGDYYTFDLDNPAGGFISLDVGSTDAKMIDDPDDDGCNWVGCLNWRIYNNQITFYPVAGILPQESGNLIVRAVFRGVPKE